MSKSDSLIKSAQHLNQAITAINQSYPNDRTALEAKTLIKQALQKLEKINVKAQKKQQSETHHSQWWGDIVANAPMAKMSLQAGMRTLKQLNSMWNEQQKIIDNSIVHNLPNSKPNTQTSNDMQILND